MASKRLEGKVAIVTGAASGIGEATARLLAEHGAYVVLADVQDLLGEQVAASIGAAAIYVHCDVTVEADVASVVQLAVDKHGRLDVMHSNAGRLGKQGSLLDMDLGEFDSIMAINVRGAAAAIKHAAKAMVQAGIRGSIVCTASTTALVGGTTPHAYTTSKSALVGLVRSAASELGKFGIRVNCVSPFAVATPMLKTSWVEFGLDPENAEAESSALGNLKGKVLKDKDVANAMLFLASEDAAYVSGHNLVVDGGFTVVNHSFSIYK